MLKNLFLYIKKNMWKTIRDLICNNYRTRCDLCMKVASFLMFIENVEKRDDCINELVLPLGINSNGGKLLGPKKRLILAICEEELN